MNDNEMYEMIKKAQSMINNNQVPDEVKNMVNNMNLNKTNNDSNFNGSANNSNNNTPNIDMETMMKIQSIMSKVNMNSDDDMSKLLYALKPYLRNEKKEKVDEYINLVKMGKMTQLFDMLNNNGNK